LYVHYFNGEWDCGASSGTVDPGVYIGCVDPNAYTLDTWQFVSSTGYPVVSTCIMYKSGGSCTGDGNCITPPATPAASNCGICSPWYYVHMKAWADPATCLSIDPENPDGTLDKCMALAEITLTYGGFDTCTEQPGATYIVEYLSGPYVNSAACSSGHA